MTSTTEESIRHRADQLSVDLTPEQEKKIDQFASWVQQEGLDSDRKSDLRRTSLYRFLVARQWDLNKACDMFRNYTEWRRELGVGNLTAEELAEELERDQGLVSGRDKLGNITMLVIPGKHDPKYDTQGILKLCVFTLEALWDLCEDEGNYEGQVTVLMDFNGWSLSNIDRQVDQAVLGAGQNYYPERLSRAILVNTPWYFRGAWNVVKNFMDRKTTDKIIFCDSSALRAYYDDDQLSTRFGGEFQDQRIPDFVESVKKQISETKSSPPDAEQKQE
eukprot:gb/GECH01014586.1/.p1 GENE.gb/GECH01014586.1/~~gb/GECH01014586.1/.p1  ORF type:complete len:276 (+),score=84.25 gb/GECH01014586.1/:1-828(+)